MAGMGVVGDLTVGDFVLVNTYRQLYLASTSWASSTANPPVPDRHGQDVPDPGHPHRRGRPVRCGRASLRSGHGQFEKVFFGYDPPGRSQRTSPSPPTRAAVAIVGPRPRANRRSAVFVPVLRRYRRDDHHRRPGPAHLDPAVGAPGDRHVPRPPQRRSSTTSPTAAAPARRNREAAGMRASTISSWPCRTATTPAGARVLSGGEKQRGGMDDPGAADPAVRPRLLDTATEREIQKARVSAGHTTLVIAHRLSTVVDADGIVWTRAGSSSGANRRASEREGPTPRCGRASRKPSGSKARPAALAGTGRGGLGTVRVRLRRPGA